MDQGHGLEAMLLVASGGGHLKQILALLPRLPPAEDYILVTYESGLSRSLAGRGLAAVEVVYVPYAAPRDLRNLARDARAIRALLRQRRFGLAVSTGAGIAVAALPLTAARGIPSHYIESATRSAGPSMTGKILARWPGITTYTQHPACQDHRWHYGGSVFDDFAVVPKANSGEAIRSAVVVLGSMQRYSFGRLIHALLRILPQDADVLWQTGATDVTDLPVEGRKVVPGDELEAAMRRADVVVAHAGTGTALSALECGKVPVLVPRRRSHGEHIDDHQEQTAAELSRRGLAVGVSVEALEYAHLQRAASLAVIPAAAHSAAFRLVTSP